MKELSEYEIRRIALETGLIDPDLSKNWPLSMVTDYGESSESIKEFVRKIIQAIEFA